MTRGYRTWPVRIVACVACVGLFVGLVVLLYHLAVITYPGNSDRASMILAGQAMSGGNPLLHGWTVPSDTYWTMDDLFYAVAVRVVGLRPGLLYVGQAVIVALAILAGALLARAGRRGIAGAAGFAVVVALLVFPPRFMELVLLGDGYHVAAVLFSLGAFAALRYARFGWAWAAAALLLAAGMLGDPLTFAYGVGPILAGGGVAMARRRDWRAGAAQVAAAVAGLVAYWLVHVVIDAVGAFALAHNPPLVPADAARNVAYGIEYLSDLVGFTRHLGGSGGLPLGLQLLHVIGGALLVASVSFGTWRLAAGAVRGRRPTGEDDPPSWRVDDMLVAAVFGSAFSFTLLSITKNPSDARYLMSTVIFASVLAGRLVAEEWPRISAGWPLWALAGGLVAAVLGWAAGTGVLLNLQTPTQPDHALIAFLGRHHLRSGLGDYWAANLSTVESDGSITIRPVHATGLEGLVVPDYYESADDWFVGQKFQFLVFQSSHWGGVDLETATNTFGKPAHIWSVLDGFYEVLAWSKPLELPVASSVAVGPSAPTSMVASIGTVSPPLPRPALRAAAPARTS